MKMFFFLASIGVASLSYSFADYLSEQKIDINLRLNYFENRSPLKLNDFEICNDQVKVSTDEEINAFVKKYINAPRQNFFETIKQCLVKLNRDPNLVVKLNHLIDRFDRL